MQVHSAVGLGSWMKKMIGLYIFFVVLIIGIGCSQMVPVTSGAPAMFAMLMTRIGYPELQATGLPFRVVKHFMQFYFVYMMLASKVCVMFYLAQCRVIRLSFHHWNQRLDIVLNRGTL